LAFALVHGAKSANEFEASMMRIHTQAGATTREVAKLTPEVLRLSQGVGIGPTGLAEGLYHLESAGFRGSQALDLLTNAAKEARIGHANLENVVQASIAVEASHIKGVHGAADAMGLLNRIVGVGDMKMEAFAKSMSSGVVPSAATFGLSMVDVGAAMATLTDNAIPAQEASTRLRMTISLMGAPSRAASKALGTIGISSSQLGHDMRRPNGLLVALQDLQFHLKKSGLDAADQAAVLSRAFGGGRSSSAILTLLSQMDRLQLKYKQLNSGGATNAQQFADAWTKTQTTTSQKMATLRSAFDTLEVRIGLAMRKVQGHLAGAATAFVNTLSSFVQNSGKSFDSGPMSKGLNDLGRIGGSISRIFHELAPAFKNIASIAGGVFLVAIHGVANAFGLIASHGGTLRTLLYILVSLWVANKIATVALAVAQAATNLVMVASTIRTGGLSAALGVNSAAKTGNLIGTRLLTAAYNSSLATLIRQTAMVVKNTAVWIAQKAVLVGQAVVMGVITVATKAWTAAQWLFNVAMNANPLVLVATLLIALGVALVLAYKHSETFRRIVTTAFHAVADAALAVGRFFQRMYNDIVRILTSIAGFVSRHWRLLLVIFTGGIGLIVVLIVNNWNKIVGVFQTATRAIVAAAQWLWRNVILWVLRLDKDVIMWFYRIYDGAWHLIDRLWRAVVGLFSRMWKDVSGFASRIWHDVSGFFSRLWHDVSSFATRIFHDVSSPFISLWHSMSNTARSLWHDVTGWFSSLRDTITNSVKTATGWIKGAWDGLKAIFKAPIEFVVNTVYNNGIRPVWNFLAGIVHEPKLQPWKMRTGGKIPGWGGGDVVPLLAERGETVVSKEHTAILTPAFKAVGVPGFATGGTVGNATGTQGAGEAEVKRLTGASALSVGSATTTILGKVYHFVRGQLANGLNAVLTPLRLLITHTLGTGHDWKGVAGNLAIRPLKALVDIVRGKDPGPDTPGGGSNAAGRMSSGAIVALGQRMAAARGWVGAQWEALNKLWTRESGWNPYAVNPTSGASGIPQALGHGHPYNLGDAGAQIAWGLNYIAGRPDQRTPMGAWAHELKFGWYDKGGKLRPGWTLAYNGTGRDERVSPQGGGANVSILAGATIHQHDRTDVEMLAKATEFALYRVGL